MTRTSGFEKRNRLEGKAEGIAQAGHRTRWTDEKCRAEWRPRTGKWHWGRSRVRCTNKFATNHITWPLQEEVCTYRNGHEAPMMVIIIYVIVRCNCFIFVTYTCINKINTSLFDWLWFYFPNFIYLDTSSSCAMTKNVYIFSSVLLQLLDFVMSTCCEIYLIYFFSSVFPAALHQIYYKWIYVGVRNTYPHN